jgi:hypothetical protein
MTFALLATSAAILTIVVLSTIYYERQHQLRNVALVNTIFWLRMFAGWASAGIAVIATFRAYKYRNLRQTMLALMLWLIGVVSIVITSITI